MHSESPAPGGALDQVDRLVNELAGMAYGYAVELEKATRGADDCELEEVAQRITIKLKSAIRKSLSNAQVVPFSPPSSQRSWRLAAPRPAPVDRPTAA